MACPRSSAVSRIHEENRGTETYVSPPSHDGFPFESTPTCASAPSTEANAGPPESPKQRPLRAGETTVTMGMPGSRECLLACARRCRLVLAHRGLSTTLDVHMHMCILAVWPRPSASRF
jgi:hypothetical protein